MKKNIKFIKATLKKIGAPIALVLGLVFGFVADRVGILLTASSLRSASHHTVKAELPAPVVSCQQAAEYHVSPLKKMAELKHRAKHVAKAHQKHAKKHKVASAKKRKDKKSLRVANSN